MSPASRTPEGESNRCPVCGNVVSMEPSIPPGDAPCPHCGQLLWWPAVISGGDFDFLVGEGAVDTIDADEKVAALSQLVERLVASGRLDANLQTVALNALLVRETLGSTAVGNGVAIPHAKLDNLSQVVGIVADVAGGIDFGSADGQPVTRLFLLLAPKDDPSRYLRALERIARSLRTLG